MCFSYYGEAQTINVCRECPINNIQKAIQLAKENDTIVVQKGVYPEHDILINKTITLLGKDRPIINGQFKGNILLVQAPNVTIKGFKLSNVAYSATSENASIRIEKCKNFHIEDNILEQIYFGIIIYKGKNGIIKNNKISLNIMKVYQHLYSPDIEMDSHENRYNKCNFNQSTCYEMNFFDNLYEANNIDGSISGLKDRGIILDSYINPRRFNPKFSGLDGKGNPYINPEWKVLEEERIIEIKKINIEDNSSITVQTITILRDTDGDGIPDKEDDDDDNDGISDAQEAIDGTNPKDKNDFKVKKICYKINA